MNRILHSLAALALLLANGCSKQESAPPPKAGRPNLVATPSVTTSDPADAAWAELEKLSEVPPPPAEWQAKRPSNEEIAAYRVRAREAMAAAADKARGFYTQFPQHPQSTTAQTRERELLEAAFRAGHTNALARLDELDDARLKAGASEDERFKILAQRAQRTAMSRRADGMEAMLKEFERGTRELQKQFPKRPEIYSMLFEVATNLEGETRRIANEILAAPDAASETKEAARALLRKLDAIGKPLALQFTALDGRAVDVAKMPGKVVLVDFWATWCAPCQTLMPLLARLADEYQGKFFLAKVNTDKEQKLAAQHGIRSLPTVKLFRNGSAVDGFMGAQPERAVRALLDKYAPSESGTLIDNAVLAQQAGDTATALALLQQALAADPANDRAMIALARVQVALARVAEAEQTLATLSPAARDQPEAVALRAGMEFARLAETSPSLPELEQAVSANPTDTEARYRLSARQVLAGRHEAAIQNLLEIVRRDRKYRDDAGRKALLAVFQLLGNNHELVKKYRPLLANALN